jgi:hypothetical protein
MCVYVSKSRIPFRQVKTTWIEGRWCVFFYLSIFLFFSCIVIKYSYKRHICLALIFFSIHFSFGSLIEKGPSRDRRIEDGGMEAWEK